MKNLYEVQKKFNHLIESKHGEIKPFLTEEAAEKRQTLGI